MKTLRIISGEGLGRLRRLPEYGPLVIGRHKSCDFRIGDECASRRHCEIVITPDGPMIVDLDSMHGVEVNDEPVKRRLLAIGDKILIGTTLLRLETAMIDEQFDRYMPRDYDGLTRLRSKRYLWHHLEQCIHDHKRFSLVFVDLVRFKAFNDAHGHLVGDQLLVEVANVLRESVRDLHTVARYGGEEFVVVLNGAPRAAADDMAKSLQIIAERRAWGTPDGSAVRFWVGTAEHVPENHKLTELFDAQCAAAEVLARADSDLLARRRSDLSSGD